MVELDKNQMVNLLGKNVSFSFSLGNTIYQTEGEVSSIVLHLNGDYELSVDDGDYYSLSELVEFEVL